MMSVGVAGTRLVATAASYVVSPSALGPVAADPKRGIDRKAIVHFRIWLGGRDSNPDTMVQSHVSYRWTTSQQDGKHSV